MADTAVDEKEPLDPDEALNLDDDNEPDADDESGDDEDKKKEETEPEAAKEPIVDTDKELELERLRQHNLELATELSLAQTRQSREPVKEEPKSKYRSDDELVADLGSKDASKVLKALREISKQAASEEADNVRGETQYDKSVRVHETAMVRDFPEIRNNPEFQQVAAAVYQQLEDEGKHPRNVYTAAATAYALMQKRGKIGVAKTEETPKPKLRIAPKSPTITKNGDGEVEEDPDDPISTLTDNDLRKIKANAKKFDIPFDDMIKNLRKKMKEDPSYGRR